jgi:hypothetical protein
MQKPAAFPLDFEVLVLQLNASVPIMRAIPALWPD